MQKTIWYLESCSTCKRIMSEIGVDDSWKKIEIKSQGISEKDLDEMKAFAGSYTALFSKRAMKYRGLGLHEVDLSETDFKKYILQEYTFLKRPVVKIGDLFFIGNSKKTVASIKEQL